MGKLKTNSDGAYIAETGEGGWGFVIRDSEGEVILSSAGKDILSARCFPGGSCGVLGRSKGRECTRNGPHRF